MSAMPKFNWKVFKVKPLALRAVATQRRSDGATKGGKKRGKKKDVLARIGRHPNAQEVLAGEHVSEEQRACSALPAAIALEATEDPFDRAHAESSNVGLSSGRHAKSGRPRRYPCCYMVGEAAHGEPRVSFETAMELLAEAQDAVGMHDGGSMWEAKCQALGKAAAVLPGGAKELRRRLRGRTKQWDHVRGCWVIDAGEE